MPIEMRERELAIQPQLRERKGEQNCERCGRCNKVRFRVPFYVCRDCRETDPDYMEMVAS